MSMPAAYPSVTTIEELLALRDDGLRHELLDGVHVVTPAPRYLHQRTLGMLIEHFQTALKGRSDAEVLMSPADIVLGSRTLVQPDLFVIARRPGVKIQRWTDVGVPLIAVEVLSETTASRDRGAKRRIYQRAGVLEYWIVDLESRIVERWRPEDERPEVNDAALPWALPGSASGTLDLDAFFRSVYEEAP
jgi:Uma2 family endonuclease